LERTVLFCADFCLEAGRNNISVYAALQYSETGIEHKELTGLNNHANFANTNGY
jgi:hypothetical protein